MGAIVNKNGVTFGVWAPFAENVFVTGNFNGWGRIQMEKDQHGYWQAEVEGAEAGSEYKFIVVKDGNEMYRNDPRSLQLTTANGNSVIADVEFDWQDDNFKAPPMNEQVIYEMHVGTFNRADKASIGTFWDAAEKLDYLKDLGVNMIELMPINPMPGDRGWGYAPTYIYAVESLYGGRRGLLEFVRAAHKRGIGVILDMVYNHFGPENLDIWRFDGWGEGDKGGIYFYNDWRSTTPWGDTRPDYGRLEVQDYILDNVAMWLADYRLDGLRIDSTIYMRNVKGYDNDPANDIPEAWHLLQRINKLAHKINPHALTVAEDSGGNHFITEAEDFGGAGFSTQWELGFPHALRSALQPVKDSDRNLGDLIGRLQSKFNADVFKRVVFTDSHDTAANGGARLTEQIAPGNAANVYARKRSLLASVFTFTAPGIPMIFQGQEFSEDGSFNDWQELDWDRAEQFKGIVTAHRHLISLRQNKHGNSRGLTGQNISILHTDHDNQVLAYHRWMDGGSGDDVIVIANLSNNTLENYRLPFPRGGAWQVRFNSSWQGYAQDFKEIDLGSVDADDSGGTVQLAPYSAIILSQN